MTGKHLILTNPKFQKVLVFLFIAGTFLLCLLTLHDVQTAQGVALYLSLTLHQENVSLFNLLVDIAGSLLLFAALFLPCLLLKLLKPESFLRFFAVYTALIPVVYPATLIHADKLFRNLQIRDFFSAGTPAQAILRGLGDTLLLFRWGIPLLLILLAINNMSAPIKLLPWQWGLIVTGILFVILHFLFPDLAEVTAYFMNYFLLIWCFSEWEKLSVRHPRFALWGNILFGGCLLRGVYRMIALMSASHL